MKKVEAKKKKGGCGHNHIGIETACSPSLNQLGPSQTVRTAWLSMLWWSIKVINLWVSTFLMKFFKILNFQRHFWIIGEDPWFTSSFISYLCLQTCRLFQRCRITLSEEWRIVTNVLSGKTQHDNSPSSNLDPPTLSSSSHRVKWFPPWRNCYF